jgi:hypothetical protein
MGSQGGLLPVSDFPARRTNSACCGRRSRVVLAPVAGVKSAEVLRAQPGSTNVQSAGDGDKRNSSPGRARRKPLKPLRAGMPGDSGVPVASTPVLFFCTGGCGCSGHPAFPTPSIFRADNFATARTPGAAGARSCVSDYPGCLKNEATSHWIRISRHYPSPPASAA